MSTDMKSRALIFRKHCEGWLPKLGTNDPVIPITQADADWLASDPKIDLAVHFWLRRYALEYGYAYVPRFEVMDA